MILYNNIVYFRTGNKRVIYSKLIIVNSNSSVDKIVQSPML